MTGIVIVVTQQNIFVSEEGRTVVRFFTTKTKKTEMFIIITTSSEC
jgi:hypothetical protein